MRMRPPAAFHSPNINMDLVQNRTAAPVLRSAFGTAGEVDGLPGGSMTSPWCKDKLLPPPSG